MIQSFTFKCFIHNGIYLEPYFILIKIPTESSELLKYRNFPLLKKEIE